MLNLSKAVLYLQKDPVLKQVITILGPLDYQPNSTNHFENLVSSIIGQQLSNKAADTIFARFTALFPNNAFTPELILTKSHDQLRAIGTSYAKARSLHDLSQRILSGSLQLNKLESLNDEEVIEYLTQVKGIGRWSAQMRLMFSLHRPDIFPEADVGIQNAIVKLYGLNRKHKSFQKEMLLLADQWKPYRTVACWYLWKYLDNKE